MNVRNTPAADPRTPARSTPTPDAGTAAQAPASTPAPAATPAPAPAATPTAVKGGATGSSTFDARAARGANGNSGIVPSAAVQQGTPDAPVKRQVT
ncbi:MAG TPA: hypothetical protein VND93_08645, partial [Myxococcales bacterium]|nr:hypothetical protein [Myxococcales bacterium]